MKMIPVKRQTVSLQTGEVTEEKTVHFGLLPPAPGKCPDCAGDHDPAWPHNPQSLYYQYAFFGEHERWPNWLDAMAHCSEEVQKQWTDSLVEMGVDVAGGKILPDGR